MIKLEIEKYLNDNHLSYNNAVRNDLGELVGIGDLIYNKTKELQERVDELEKLHTLGLQALVESNNEKANLQAKIDELESVNNDLKQAMIRGSELNDKLKFD